MYNETNMVGRVCYIRREGEPWTRAREHHFTAFCLYLNNGLESERMETPHVDGGQFVATFSHRAEDDRSVSAEYVDAYGRVVGIMLCRPEYAAYINRLTDF